jgi:hypothetical protein
MFQAGKKHVLIETNLMQMSLSRFGSETRENSSLGGCLDPFAAQNNFVSQIIYMPKMPIVNKS